jgi:hypothetical protein
MNVRRLTWGVSVAAGLLLLAPPARADLTAGVAPALEVQVGCAVWQASSTSGCYIVSNGVYGGVNLSTGDVNYYAGTPDSHAQSGSVWNIVGYAAPGQTGIWEDIEPGEVQAGLTGDLASVNADVAGCAVQFELHRTLDSQDGLAASGPAVFPRRPSVGASAAVEKTSILGASGGVCGVEAQPASLGFSATIVITGAGGGEEADVLQAAINDIAARLHIPAPTLPEQIPPR